MIPKVGIIPRCAVVYHYIARYRLPIFEALSRSKSVHFVFISDDKTPEAALELAPLLDHPSISWVHVHNTWIFSAILWQYGVIKEALLGNFECFIFLGERRFASTWVAALLARFRGKRVLFWTHGLTKRDRGLSRCIRHAFYRIPNGILLYGTWARRQLMSWGLSADSLYVVFNSLDYDTQKTLFEHLTSQVAVADKLNSRPYQLATIGRLITSKNFDLVVEAASILMRRGLSLTVTIIGGGPELSNLRRKARLLGIQQVVNFVGPTSHEHEIGPILFSADVCVLPEKVGLGVIHALSYGTPVIVHDEIDRHTPEIDAFRDGETGAVFRRGSVQDLARAIEAWLERKLDRQQVRQACRRRIDLYFNPTYQREVIERAVHAVAAEGPPSD